MYCVQTLNTAIPKTTQAKTNTLETKQTHTPTLSFTVAPVPDTSFILSFKLATEQLLWVTLYNTEFLAADGKKKKAKKAHRWFAKWTDD